MRRLQDNRLRVVRRRAFRLLFFGRTVSLIGDGLAPVAIAFAVLELTGSVTDLGIVLAGRSFVMVALIVAGGVFADRLSPRTAMLRADLARVVVMGCMAVALLTGAAEVWQLAVLYGLEGLATALFNPASSAVVPFVVPPRELQEANALLNLSRSAGKVAGPALAGLVLAISSPGVAIAVDAATFGVSAMFLVGLETATPLHAKAASFVTDLREGWTEFSSRTWLWACVLAAALSNAVFFPSFQVLGPEIARVSLGGAGAWSLIAAAFGVGALVGGAVALAIQPRRPLLAGESIAVVAALPLVLLATGADTLAVAAGALAAGAAFSFAEILYETAIQHHVPPAVMGRVNGYDWLGSLAIQPLGFLVIGPLAEGLGTSSVLWLGAAVLAAVQGGVALVPSVRRVRYPERTLSKSSPAPTLAKEEARIAAEPNTRSGDF